uniref:Uncharacterized protein n=1 Tax=Pyxicephalus adspersus TaxID=30357 RepID=A0AAV2ZFA4_PYXAD|nr:TPA: hypothetical protein GDO54_004331 [Pyxicephalus adspersus]
MLQLSRCLSIVIQLLSKPGGFMKSAGWVHLAKRGRREHCSRRVGSQNVGMMINALFIRVHVQRSSYLSLLLYVLLTWTPYVHIRCLITKFLHACSFIMKGSLALKNHPTFR